MSKKSQLIVSLALFALTILFVLGGIALFNLAPNTDVSGYTPKDSVLMTVMVFSFIFAIGALIGSIVFLIDALSEE